MEKKTLSTKAKVGISSGAVLVLGVVAFFVVRRVRKARKAAAAK